MKVGYYVFAQAKALLFRSCFQRSACDKNIRITKSPQGRAMSFYQILQARPPSAMRQMMFALTGEARKTLKRELD